MDLALVLHCTLKGSGPVVREVGRTYAGTGLRLVHSSQEGILATRQRFVASQHQGDDTAILVLVGGCIMRIRLEVKQCVADGRRKAIAYVSFAAAPREQG
jgi:hypothetical protein